MIYAYMRVSTQTQVDNNGIQMQEVAIENYCKAQNIVLDGFYSDLGISGATLERDGLIDLLNAIKEGDKILVLNTSRLWRDDTVRLMVTKEIQKAKADVISIEQPTFSVYISSPNDYLFNSLFAILDVYDKMQISLKLAKGRRAKAKNGDKACGTMPYGYTWRENKTEIDYNNHLIVREIFEQYDLYLNHIAVMNPLGKVVEYCKEKGYKTHRGNDFSKQTLSVMLHNDFYIGIVTHGDKKVLGNHEPIIDRELFENVNPSYDFSIFG